MAVQDYKINYKSDFVLNINGDAGWAVPFCIKFWTGMPSQAYFVGFDGVKYVNCRVGDTPTQLLVMFDDHHLPIGPLRMQIAYHTTIEEFPGSVFDEVTNARDVIVTIDGTDYQVLLDFTGEDAPELEFDLPAYANEAERIQNELQRQQNEADRIAAELQREQATAAAVQGAENVNAQLSGNTLTVTNRLGVSTSVNTKGEQGERGPVGPEGPQGEQGVSIVDFSPKSQTTTTLIYTATFSDGHTQDVAIPKGPKGDTGATGPTGPQGPQGQTGVSITGLVKTGETETDTLYNVTFSNGTTQAVAIPKGEKGDQGPQGPVGPQGPMGDVAVITPEQQAAFTMYSEPGQNTDGPMTQKAVTDALVAGSISYDNSQSGLASNNVQGALDEVAGDINELNANKIVNTIDIKSSTKSNQHSFFDNTNIGLVVGKRYFIQSYSSQVHSNTVSFYLREVAGSKTVKFNLGVNIPAGQNYSEKIIYTCTDASAQYLSMYTAANKASQFIVKFEEIEFEDVAQRILSNCCADGFCLNGHILKGAAYSPSNGAFMFQNLLDCTELIEVPKDSVFVNISQGPFWSISCYDKDLNFLTNRSTLPDFDRKIGWLDECTRYISISFLKSENIDYANLFITFSDSDNYKICSNIGFKAGIMYSKAYNPNTGQLATFNTLDCTPALLVPESFSQIYKINCNKKFYQIACINANKEVIGGVSYPATSLLANTKYISVSFLKTDSIDYSDLRISLVSNENSNENYSVIPTSRKQKKYYAFGDSITYWDSRTSWYDPDVYMIGYPSYMRNILGAEVVNEGVAGQTANQITTRLLATNLADAYAVTFMAGANDLNNSVPVGTIGQFDRSTYIGNLETAIQYVLTNYPKVKMYLLSPLWESHAGWEAYANAMQSVADYYGVPILRWDRISGLNTFTADTFYVIEGTSRVHPNNDGYARLADCLIPFLQSC